MFELEAGSAGRLGTQRQFLESAQTAVHMPAKCSRLFASTKAVELRHLAYPTIVRIKRVSVYRRHATKLGDVPQPGDRTFYSPTHRRQFG